MSIYKVYQEYLYSVKDLYYIESEGTSEEDLKKILKFVIGSKIRQGYNSDESGEILDDPYTTLTDDEHILESDDPKEYYVVMTRIPFCGHTVDPETFEVDETPTGMTETITLHVTRTPQPYGPNPDTIPIFPINCGGM